jgi:type VI secretion system secreted protein Hcp
MTNRRDVFRGAAGLAAAGAIGGVITGSPAQAAGGQAVGQGATITGQVGDLGPFEVLAFSWGLSNSGSTHVGGGAGAGKANVQDVSLTKYIDQNSPDLFIAVASGSHFPQATLTFVGRAGSPVVEIAMEDVLVTSLSTGASGGESIPTENVSLNFALVTFTVNGESETWDIAGNTGG